MIDFDHISACPNAPAPRAGACLAFFNTTKAKTTTKTV